MPKSVVQQVKQDHNLAYWTAVITEQKQSGLSANQFCLQKGIARSTFYQWQYKIREKLIQHLPEEKLPPAKDTVQFTPVKISNKTKAADSICVHCGAFSVEVNENTSPELLKRTLRLLQDVVSC